MPPGASLLAQGSERRAQRSNLHRREQDSGTYWGGGGGGHRASRFSTWDRLGRVL